MNELSKALSAHWRHTDMSALLIGYRSQAVRQACSSAQSAFDTVLAALLQRKVASLIFPSRSFFNPHHYLIWTSGNTRLTYRLFTAPLFNARTGRLRASRRCRPTCVRSSRRARCIRRHGGLP